MNSGPLRAHLEYHTITACRSSVGRAATLARNYVARQVANAALALKGEANRPDLLELEERLGTHEGTLFLGTTGRVIGCTDVDFEGHVIISWAAEERQEIGHRIPQSWASFADEGDGTASAIGKLAQLPERST